MTNLNHLPCNGFSLIAPYSSYASITPIVMEDFTPADIAINDGYYQPTDEAGLWIVAAIGLLVGVTWLLNRQFKTKKLLE